MMSSRAWFRAVLCLSTALMMAISWPLWVTGGDFPRVPWIGGTRLLPAWASWVRFVVAMAAMIAASWPESWRFGDQISRPTLIVALAASTWMVLEDQFRLQPWTYQFLLMGFAIAACPPGQAARLCRWFVIAQYLHSGLSKLDHQFMNDMGRWFLFHGANALGIKLKSWTGPRADAMIFAMPCWELAVAGLLAFGARRLGLFGAAAMHVALIAILGPWGMDHSANVLIWNAALLVEVVLLFGVGPARVVDPNPCGRAGRVFPVIAMSLIVAAALLPLGERSGYWDTWPSFGLYSSSEDRVIIGLSGEKADFSFPVRGWGWTPHAGIYVHRVDINLQAWSLRDRRVPLYPSGRALNGVAEALGSRYVGQRALWVRQDGRANRRSGLRQGTELIGLDAVRRHADTYWLNAHPAR